MSKIWFISLFIFLNVAAKETSLKDKVIDELKTSLDDSQRKRSKKKNPKKDHELGPDKRAEEKSVTIYVDPKNQDDLTILGGYSKFGITPEECSNEWCVIALTESQAKELIPKLEKLVWTDTRLKAAGEMAIASAPAVYFSNGVSEYKLMHECLGTLQVIESIPKTGCVVYNPRNGLPYRKAVIRDGKVVAIHLSGSELKTYLGKNRLTNCIQNTDPAFKGDCNPIVKKPDGTAGQPKITHRPPQ